MVSGVEQGSSPRRRDRCYAAVEEGHVPTGPVAELGLGLPAGHSRVMQHFADRGEARGTSRSGPVEGQVAVAQQDVLLGVLAGSRTMNSACIQPELVAEGLVLVFRIEKA